MTAWLCSERAGVISHRTALSLHGLSGALPAQIDLMLPRAWRARRFGVPAGVVRHRTDVPSVALRYTEGSRGVVLIVDIDSDQHLANTN